jgi:hypothetical protein
MPTTRLLQFVLPVALVLGAAASGGAQDFEIARIYIEYNESGNDLGFHVFLDGEEWTDLKIFDPSGKKIFDVAGKGGYDEIGLTELFFEGAEPNLSEFPLDDLLALFPEGQYTFVGKTIDNERLMNTATLTHDVPAGPSVFTAPSPYGDTIEIGWTSVVGPAAILPGGMVTVVGYQVIVGSLHVTLPASAVRVTIPPEYYQALGAGTHEFEVLAIDASGNQTITEGTFDVP